MRHIQYSIASAAIILAVGCASIASNDVSEKDSFTNLLNEQPSAAGQVLYGTGNVPAEYNFVDISGDGFATAEAINNQGVVAGTLYEPNGWNYGCETAYTMKHYINDSGNITIIGEDQQPRCLTSHYVLLDINDNNTVAGTLNGRAYRYENGWFQDLHDEIKNALEGGVSNGSGAITINNQGHIGGYIYSQYSVKNAILFNGQQWQKVMTGSMPMLSPSVSSLNEMGQGIVRMPGYRGYSTFNIYDNGSLSGPQGFQAFNQSPYSTHATAMNDSGHYVGNWDAAGDDYSAYINVNNLAYPLGMLNGSQKVYPAAINNDDVIVGTAGGSAWTASATAVVYEDGNWVDLNTKANGVPTGWRLVTASDINNAGEIVGRALVDNGYKAYKLIPVMQTDQVFLRGTFNGWGSLAMNKVDDQFEAEIEIDSSSAEFKFDLLGDWSDNYGDTNGDSRIDQFGDNIRITSGAGSYLVTLDMGTRYYSITKTNDNEGGPMARTVILLHGITQPGQDMYLRGGLDHGYAQSSLSKNCTSTNFECAIPINHRIFPTDPKRAADLHLDWYGPESGQGNVEGSALVWTTNRWPAEWGPKRTVSSDGYGETPINSFGAHYWMLDIDMDCSKTADGWFEVKSYISGGPGWEPDINQSETPYASGNHFAKCGKLNKFERGSSAALITDLP